MAKNNYFSMVVNSHSKIFLNVSWLPLKNIYFLLWKSSNRISPGPFLHIKFLNVQIYVLVCGCTCKAPVNRITRFIWFWLNITCFCLQPIVFVFVWKRHVVVRPWSIESPDLSGFGQISLVFVCNRQYCFCLKTACGCKAPVNRAIRFIGFWLNITWFCLQTAL